MKKLLCSAVVISVWMLVFSTNNLNAQVIRQIIGAGGSIKVMVGNATVSSTIGQPIIIQVQTGNVRVNQGFWYFYRVPPTVGVELEQASDLRAMASYPNPFRTTTTISYYLDKPAYMRLTICDLLGRPVKVLVDERREAGTNQAAWDGSDEAGNAVGSGIYLYRLEVQPLSAQGNRSTTTCSVILVR